MRPAGQPLRMGRSNMEKDSRQIARVANGRRPVSAQPSSPTRWLFKTM